MSATILVVEDEPAIQELVAYACRNQGYAVQGVASVQAAHEVMREALPDLVILDWMLPDRTGIELLRDLRAQPRTRALPIIMLTARGDEADRISGLDAGADDYIVKPFSPKELLSRVRAVFRRKAPQHSQALIEQGPLKIDPDHHSIEVNGQTVQMGLAEFKLLKFLASHPGRVYSRAQLLDQVWGDHVFIEERTVDVHILRLRKALAPVQGQHLVQTVRGLGYRFSTDTDGDVPG